MKARLFARLDRSGFTLVEMLVVIAIIALLITFIAPAVGNTMERGRTTACASNMKQVAAAVIQFAADQEGRLPFLQRRAAYEGVTSSWGGDLVLGGYIDAPFMDDRNSLPDQSVFRCPSGMFDEPSAGPTTDGPWTENPNAHRPWTTEVDTEDGTKHLHIWFGLNARTEAHPSGSNTQWPFYRTRGEENFYARMTQIQLPATMVMIYDGVWTHNSTPLRIYARHGILRRFTNFAFMDGSVRTLETRMFATNDGSEDSNKELFPRFRKYHY